MTEAEEKEIVVTCQILQELGYGLTRGIVTRVVHDYLQDQKRESPFRDSAPGADWWAGFMGRWPSLSERKPQHLSTKRAMAGNPETMESWFATVQDFLKKVGLLKRRGPVADYACRIWNADETGFCLGSTSKKILARRGTHSVHEVSSTSDHQFITVSACGNAAGLKLPPFILYKGKHLYTTWTQGGPAAACYSVSESGWMEESNLLKWFEQQFYPSIKHLLTTGPVVLFFDGHFSHMSISLIKKARSLGIHLFCLPPNTTHILQPLDIGVFGPMKQQWRTILKQHKIATRATNITKERFPALIKQLWETSIKPEHLEAGFRAAGLVPFNPKAVKPTQLAPSVAVTQTSVAATGKIRAVLTIHAGETPIRTELRCYFREVLKPSSEQQSTRRRRIELSCAGEVLTSDEVVERIEKADAEKAAKKAAERAAKKAAKKASKSAKSRKQAQSTAKTQEQDTVVHCEECAQIYTDAQADSWIGCDSCETWWHYWCAGLPAMLTEEDDWLCCYCGSH